MSNRRAVVVMIWSVGLAAASCAPEALHDGLSQEVSASESNEGPHDGRERTDGVSRVSRDVRTCGHGGCTPCRTHAGCASDVCDTTTRPWWGGGRCVDEADVVYVDPDTCAGPTCVDDMTCDGSRAAPFCTISTAAAAASSAGKHVIRVTGNLHRPVIIENPADLHIFGSGGVVGEEDSGGFRVGGAGSLTIDDLQLGNSSSTGFSCRQTSTETLAVKISRAGFDGLSAGAFIDGCTIDIDRAHVYGLRGLVLTNARYRIRNTAIRADTRAVVIDGGGGTFAFNTIYGIEPLGAEPAVDCRTPARIENSIVAALGVAWTGLSPIGPLCALDRVVVNALDPTPAPGAVKITPALDGFRLIEAPANRACCIDRARPDLRVLHDIDGGRRPRGRGWDIGAHELPPPR